MTFFFSNLHFGGPQQVLGPPTGTGAPTRYWGPYALCVLCLWGVAALHVTYSLNTGRFQYVPKNIPWLFFSGNGKCSERVYVGIPFPGIEP